MRQSKMSKTTVFLIEEDHDNRRLLRESFKAADYKVSLAIDEEDALERAAAGCLKADLVLINLLGKSLDEVLEIGRDSLPGRKAKYAARRYRPKIRRRIRRHERADR